MRRAKQKSSPSPGESCSMGDAGSFTLTVGSGAASELPLAGSDLDGQSSRMQHLLSSSPHGGRVGRCPLARLGWLSLAALGLLAAEAGRFLVRAADQAPLAVRLGYQAGDRLLIVNCDDVGMCHAANAAVIEGMEQGLISSGTIMVPCPWFPEIAAYAKTHPEQDFGVHLCYTAEWKFYRWGPVLPAANVPGLVDPAGRLWPSIEEVYAHATPDEARREGRAQIRRALAAGVDVTHLDSHMGTLQYDLRYVAVYLDLAREFDLPVRMASQSTLAKFGQPGLREQFTAAGIVFPDYLIHEELNTMGTDVAGFWRGVVANLKPGVTELYVHAAKPTPELQAITGSWRRRGAEFVAFTQDAALRELIREKSLHLIGYRALRDLQRREEAQQRRSAP